jgi:hypothetical protein
LMKFPFVVDECRIPQLFWVAADVHAFWHA